MFHEQLLNLRPYVWSTSDHHDLASRESLNAVLKSHHPSDPRHVRRHGLVRNDIDQPLIGQYHAGKLRLESIALRRSETRVDETL